MLFDRRSLSRLLFWPCVAAGFAGLALTAYNFTPGRADARLLLFSLVALSLGTRVVVKVPRARAYVSLAETFCVLSLFVFGAEGPVLLASFTAVCASLRLTREWRRLLLDGALATLSLLAAGFAVTSYVGAPETLARPETAYAFGLSLLLVAFLQTASGAFVLPPPARPGAPADAPFTPARFFWTFSTKLALASFAGLGALACWRFGLDPFLYAVTAAAVLHFAHAVYQRKDHADRTAADPSGPAPFVAADEGTQLFMGAFEHAAIGMALVSPKGGWLRANRSLCYMLGYTERELLAKGFDGVVHPDDLGQALAHVKDLLRGSTATYQSEKRFINKHGEDVWVLWSVAPIRDSETEEVRLIFQAQDITDRKLSEGRLLHNAFHDALTGLPNRALFIDHVKLTIARSKRRDGHLFAVLFLDLDRFKVINDSLGHMVGDQLLVGIARRLEACLREGDTVARVGGDEFTILLEDIEDEDEAVQVAERIQKELSQPFTLDGREVFTTASIGIAPSSTGYEDPEDILRDADTAMYRAKSAGKARHEVFDRAMHAVAVNLLQLETDLRKALERRELYLVYQPIVGLDDFRLCGFEALVRWNHPERGLVSPLDFIPVAEDTGQIIALGQWALLEACRQMRRWQRSVAADAHLFMSVNLSSKQFNQPDLIEQVRSILTQTRLSPRNLKLEITESAVMENIETATEMLKQLRALGVQLAIDDFGTGYSSLSYLHRFPIDTLKIDRSFVTRMSENNENTEIVRTIVVLAQNLGMDVVAEGVETKEQLALLRRLGCENGQGYYFSRPSSEADAEKIIAETCARPKPAPKQEVPAVVIMDDKVKSVRMIETP
ncbi:MAG TPA: EAL domain-containing protein [Pyrinomonadaceae bacterium]|jgi:diguanylate cyclase (GGDEF)-like protein/PAS domain S-box-containing protein|nr:EAL domain-containing protein [Pyrinomonadaceae bacterium]